MADPFIGEIRMFAGNFTPSGWALCNGTLLPIRDHIALYSLLGTTYGGDGRSTFALPNFQGRVPLHQGTLDGDTYQLGQRGGEETCHLTADQLPSHSHAVQASTAQPPAALGALRVTNTGQTWVPASPAPKPRLYAAPAELVAMAPAAVLPAGDGQPHWNMAPYLAVYFIIALDGVFPTFS